MLLRFIETAMTATTSAAQRLIDVGERTFVIAYVNPGPVVPGIQVATSA